MVPYHNSKIKYCHHGLMMTSDENDRPLLFIDALVLLREVIH
jgi:hypothetical protein